MVHDAPVRTCLTVYRYTFGCGVYLILETLYQQIGLKFEEETSKMLHLEHGFVWC